MWTSPYAPVEVGGTTLHRMVLEAAARFGDRPALVDGPDRHDRELPAAGRAGQGWRPGWPPPGSARGRAGAVGAQPAPVGRGGAGRHGGRHGP